MHFRMTISLGFLQFTCCSFTEIKDTTMFCTYTLYSFKKPHGITKEPNKYFFSFLKKNPILSVPQSLNFFFIRPHLIQIEITVMLYTKGQACVGFWNNNIFLFFFGTHKNPVVVHPVQKSNQLAAVPPPPSSSMNST